MDAITGKNESNNINNLSPTNLLNKYKNQQPSTPPKESIDEIVINRDFIADLKPCKDKYAIGTIVEGTVNNSPVTFKIVSNNEHEVWCEGAMDKKYFLLHGKDQVYDGKYGNSEFKLCIDYKKPSKIANFFKQELMGKVYLPDTLTIKGNIGGKNIDLILPGMKIPKDQETRDIITIILEDNGLKAQTINGEVKSIKLASSEIANIKKRNEKRKKQIDDNVKPIVMQGISNATGMVVGAMVSALLLKFGLKR